MKDSVFALVVIPIDSIGGPGTDRLPSLRRPGYVIHAEC